MAEGEQARGKGSGDPRGISGSGQRARTPLRRRGPRNRTRALGTAPAASPEPGGAERSVPAAPGRTHGQTHTHTQHHPCPAAALPFTTAKMLLLLLGIIVLHVTVLVLLFVSTIVSVSTDFPRSEVPRGREGHGVARAEGGIFTSGCFYSLAFSREPYLAGCWPH